MKKKHKKKKILWQQYLAMAFLVLLGAACGFFMMMYMDRQAGSDRPLYMEILSFVGLFLGMYAAVLIQLILHEAGHLIFGLISGYRFSSFRIGSFMWVKEGEQVRFKRLSIAGTGGQCLMIPPEMVDGRLPVVLYNLGGSLLNLMAGGVFLLLFFLFSGIQILSVFLLLISLMGFAVAVMNGVPMRMGMVDNDGYNAFSLTRNPDAMRSFWIQMKVNEQISKGIRLKDMPMEWFAVPSDEAMENSMVAVMGVFAGNRLMDEQKFGEAEKLMKHLLGISSGIVDLHRKLIVCDRMYVELITENRPDVLNRMFGTEQRKFMKKMKNFPSVLRTRYVYELLHEKNTGEAKKVKAQFEKCAGTYPYPSEVQAERELMELAEKAALSEG